MKAGAHRVIVAIDSVALCTRILHVVENAGYRPILLGPSHRLRELPATNDVILLETKDDVAALNQLVYGLYMSWQAEHTLPIIALLSQEALNRNPQLGFWDIEGHAALTALIPVEEKDLEEMILLLLERLLPDQKS